MALLFTATPAIKRAVASINALEPSKFPLLLTRITQKLHLKDDRTFSEEEETKLQDALALTAGDLELVLQTLEFFLQQAAYHAAKPAVFTQQLQQLDMDEDKVKTVVEAWTSSGREVVQRLRQRTLNPKQLEDINWRLSLQMAQATQVKMKMPNAMFELAVKNENTDTREKIRMEFTHDELYKFYNQLETIQKQLDSLS
ncbi:COMM domain-containing protein 10-like [Mizuhopecten yessoensis]|uniref:COMM domain-containing protein 10 n=1 Tax=Mizuhopecten yessoensis TaxID=6573 RepID=A0A210QYZ1_MIZYE|nr:COMM domain-containing protein 10-like [Mizuhopecten yessoensis]OWF53988.1 COMM domain-containing protein 10 [Mizuhopecten yessoensis]